MLSLADVEHEYDNFALRMKQILKPYDYKLVPLGYDPQNHATSPSFPSRAIASWTSTSPSCPACMPNA